VALLRFVRRPSKHDALVDVRACTSVDGVKPRR
jgi:hypothetical protein